MTAYNYQINDFFLFFSYRKYSEARISIIFMIKHIWYQFFGCLTKCFLATSHGFDSSIKHAVTEPNQLSCSYPLDISYLNRWSSPNNSSPGLELGEQKQIVLV